MIKFSAEAFRINAKVSFAECLEKKSEGFQVSDKLFRIQAQNGSSKGGIGKVVLFRLLHPDGRADRRRKGSLVIQQEKAVQYFHITGYRIDIHLLPIDGYNIPAKAPTGGRSAFISGQGTEEKADFLYISSLFINPLNILVQYRFNISLWHQSGRFCRRILIAGPAAPYDQFCQVTKFDIFLPYDYDASKKYPLVLYLEDEYSCANQHDAPLTEGLGAVIWATPEEQSRQPSIVLVPVLKNNVADTAYHVNADFSAIPNLLDTIENLYHVDRSRVYLVGQSLGARAALALQERYPHRFAASLLVSGAWNPATASRLKDEHLLFVAADADSDTKAEVTAYIKQLKKAGAKASSKTVDMGQAHETVDGDISLLTEDSANVKCLLMKAGTIVPKGIPDNALCNKTYTWRLVYQYASVRNWLFKQVLK